MKTEIIKNGNNTIHFTKNTLEDAMKEFPQEFLDFLSKAEGEIESCFSIAGELEGGGKMIGQHLCMVKEKEVYKIYFFLSKDDIRNVCDKSIKCHGEAYHLWNLVCQQLNHEYMYLYECGLIKE